MARVPRRRVPLPDGCDSHPGRGVAMAIPAPDKVLADLRLCR